MTEAVFGPAPPPRIRTAPMLLQTPTAPPRPGSAPPATLALRVRDALGSSGEHPIGGAPLTLGGGPKCSVRFRGPGVRPLHCVVSSGAMGATIRRWADGTLLNGETFVESALAAGDLLTIGPFVVEVVPRTRAAAPSAGQPAAPQRSETQTAALAAASDAGHLGSDGHVDGADGPAPLAASPLAPRVDETDWIPEPVSGVPAPIASPLPAAEPIDPAVPARLLRRWTPSPAPPSGATPAIPPIDPTDEWSLLGAPPASPEQASVASPRVGSEAALAEPAIGVGSGDHAGDPPRSSEPAQRSEPAQSSEATHRTAAEQQNNEAVARLRRRAASLRGRARRLVAQLREARRDAQQQEAVVASLRDTLDVSDAAAGDVAIRAGALQAAIDSLRQELQGALTRAAEAEAALQHALAAPAPLPAPAVEAEPSQSHEVDELPEAMRSDEETVDWTLDATAVHQGEAEEESASGASDPITDEAQDHWVASQPADRAWPSPDEESPAEESHAEEPYATAYANEGAADAAPALGAESDPAESAAPAEFWGPDTAESVYEPSRDASPAAWDDQPGSANELGEPWGIERLGGLVDPDSSVDIWASPVTGDEGDGASPISEARSDYESAPQAASSPWDDSEPEQDYEELPETDAGPNGPWNGRSAGYAPNDGEEPIHLAGAPRNDQYGSVDPTDDASDPAEAAGLPLGPKEVTSVDPSVDPRSGEPEPAKEPFTPTSFLDRFSHLIGEGESEAEASHTEPAEQVATASPAKTESFGADGDDESIDDYMRKLLARMRGDEPEPARPAAPSPAAAPKPVASAPVATPMVEEPVAPIRDLGELRRSAAPERTADIGALRSLANQSARVHIDAADRNEHRQRNALRLVISGTAMACGAFAAATAPTLLNEQFLAGVAGVVAGLGFGAASLRGKKRRLTLERLAAPHDAPDAE